MTATTPPPLEVIDCEKLTRLDEQAAKLLDGKIRETIGKLSDDTYDLLKLLKLAKDGQIHEALGFDSWTAYVSDAVQIVPTDRAQRQVLVTLMSGEGMSQRAIASVLGVDQKTVSNDLRSGEENSSPGTVDGLDGKTYPPKPKEVERKPRREPITDEWGSAVHVLSKAVDRLTKTVDCLAGISEDNRFTRNRDKLALHRSDLERAITTLQAVVDKLSTDDAAVKS